MKKPRTRLYIYWFGHTHPPIHYFANKKKQDIHIYYDLMEMSKYLH